MNEVEFGCFVALFYTYLSMSSISYIHSTAPTSLCIPLFSSSSLATSPRREASCKDSIFLFCHLSSFAFFPQTLYNEVRISPINERRLL